MEKNKKEIKVCDECRSSYYAHTSRMESLCPECSHVLYDYENCSPEMINGRCTKCYWDGSTSAYLLKKQDT